MFRRSLAEYEKQNYEFTAKCMSMFARPSPAAQVRLSRYRVGYHLLLFDVSATQFAFFFISIFQATETAAVEGGSSSTKKAKN